MRQFEKWWLGLGLIGALCLLVIQPTRAEEITGFRAIEIPHLSEVERLATTVDEWMAQVEQASTEITNVRLNSTGNGIEIVLETAEGQLSTPSTSVVGNALIADIPNAVLTLPSGDEFQVQNPTEGIALVSVTNLPDNRVQVAITGLDAPPTAEVSTSEQGFVLSVTLGIETDAAETDEDVIQLVVTAEQKDGYAVEDATTATRTDTPIRDIPQSISVIPQQVLEDQGGTRLNDALRNVPGVTIEGESSRTLFDSFTVRGFSSPSILRNGLREGNSSNFGISLGTETANVERIEVLRGPASVLYGQGGLGGTINIVTEQPLSEPFYEVEGTVDSYGFYRGSLDISGSLTSDRRLLYRLNAAVQTNESFIDFLESQTYFVAPTIAWEISDDTRLTLEAEYLERNQPNYDWGLPAEGTVLPNPNGEIPRNRYSSDPELDEQRRRIFRVGYNFEHRFSEDWQLRNAFRASFLSLEQVNIFPIELRPDKRTLVRGVADIPYEQSNFYTFDTYVTGNFRTGSIEHQLVTGFDLSRQETLPTEGFDRAPIELDLFNPEYGLPLPPITGRNESASRADALGIYVQDQVTLLDNLILVAGGRFDIVNQENRNLIAETTDFQQDEAFSPRIGIVYQPIEPISLYASYSQGFRQVTGTTFDNRLFEPERSTQYEVGVKADLTDQLFATLAFYDLTRSNVLTTNPDNPNFSIQTGEQRSRGIEFDVTGEILPSWNVIATYAYTDARITESNDFPEGNRLNSVPEHAASLWTTYEIQDGDFQGLGFGLGLFFVGEREGDLANSFSVPSYLRTDAALYYRRDSFRAAINVKNLFDINYFNDSGYTNLRVYPGDPITVQGTISWEF